MGHDVSVGDASDWAKPDRQMEAESAELLRRVSAFLTQDPGPTPLQAFENFSRKLMLDFAAVIRGATERQRARMFAHLASLDVSILKRRRGRPRTSRARPVTALGGGMIPKRGPQRVYDHSAIENRIWDKRLAAEREGRQLFRRHALAEILAEDIRRADPAKGFRLDSWQQYFETEKGYSPARALASALTKFHRARYRNLQRTLRRAKTGQPSRRGAQRNKHRPVRSEFPA